MRGPAELLRHQDRIETRMGGWFPGERVVFRGHDLHVELRDMDWVELYVYGITGRRFSAAELRVMHAIWMYTSFPDPRLWNNRVAALAGSARSTGNLAVSAALAVSEATIYGRRPDIRAIDFLLRTKAELDGGKDLAAIVRQEAPKRIYGYGRPLVVTDERIPHMMSLIQELGLADRPFVQMAFAIERLLSQGRLQLRMNFGGMAAALGADFGFSAREYYLFVIPAFVAGMVPCFVEASEKPEGSFLPVSCDRVVYEGPKHRPWD